MESQIHEGGATGDASRFPEGDAAARQRRHQQVRQNLMRRYMRGDQYRDLLISFYGPEKGRQIEYAQAFEICEYGRRPNKEELKKIFPFFPE
jgi:hypothetical protein